MNQDNDNKFINDESLDVNNELQNNNILESSDDFVNDNNTKQTFNKNKKNNFGLRNKQNNNNFGMNYRKNNYSRNRFGLQNASSRNSGEENPNESESADSKKEENKSSNPLKNLNPLNKKKNNNVDESTQDAINGTKKVLKLIKMFLHIKVILLVGAVVILVVFIMVLLATIFDSDTSSSDSSNDQSTGTVIREAAKSAYKCTTTTQATDSTPATNNGVATADINLGAMTPLSRQEFIDKVNSYTGASSARCSKAQAQAAHQRLAEKAGYIYDLGVKLGINPEIVYIRAQAEGYSPSCITSLAGYNNFYGMGCGNGKSLSTCSNFASVEAGVYNESNPKSSAFLNWIVRNSTESKNYSYVFGTYHWIGDYWTTKDGAKFSNGKLTSCSDWGLGGCCYSIEVEKYLRLMGRADRIEEIRKACQGGGSAIKTLRDMPSNNYRAHWFDESNLDQRAYTLSRTEDVIRIRKQIFGIEGDAPSTTPTVCSGKTITVDISSVLNDKSDNALKGTTIAEKLLDNGTSIDAVNQQMLDTIMKSTPGTREAVVNAGKFLVNTFAAYNTKVAYMYTGGNSNMPGKNGKMVAKTNESYYGINPYFGAELSNPYKRSSSQIYYYSGLDCSGFVHWALHNGGLNIPYLSTSTYINKASEYHITLRSLEDARGQGKIQIGDVLVKNDGGSNHHAALIIEFDNESITVLEEVGKGLMARKRYYNDESDKKYLSIFKVADMSYWYDNSPNYTDFRQTFNNGLIKVD